MINLILSSLILFAASTITPIESPTLPHKPGEIWKLNISYPIADDFIKDTCTRFDIDKKSVVRILSEEYERQLYQSNIKTKKVRIEALERTIGWCVYWRDTCPRVILTPKLIASDLKAECFFRAIQIRSY